MSPEMEYNTMRMLAGVYDWCRCIAEEAAAKSTPGESLAERHDAAGVVRVLLGIDSEARDNHRDWPASIREAIYDLWHFWTGLECAMEPWRADPEAGGDEAMEAMQDMVESSIPQWRAEIR